MTWDLQAIRAKVRQLTGRLSIEELSNASLDGYINDFYIYTFPADVKLDENKVQYSFLTDKNEYRYSAPTTSYTNFSPPARINNLELTWYQDPELFDRESDIDYIEATPFTGDGSTVTFSDTLGTTPILQGSLVVYDGVEKFEDTTTSWTDSNVTLTGDQGGSGTINYDTGSLSVTFNSAPPNGDSVFVNYIGFKAGRPRSILYFDNVFKLWPPPNQAYKVEMMAWETVSELTSPSDTPPLQQWGPVIAYGASKQVVADFGEMQAYQELHALYKEQIAYTMRRTHQNLLNTRARPTF